MKIVDSITQGSKLSNEDSIGYGKNYAYVLDGATSLVKNEFTKKYNAHWYVKKFSKLLNKNIIKNEDLRLIIKETICDMRNEFGINTNIDAYQIPSACIAIVKENNDNFEFFCLGDCTILYNKGNDIFEFTNSEITKLDIKVIDKMVQKSIEEKIDVIDSKKYVELDLINNRNKRNKIDGYYSLDFNDDVVENGKYIKIEKKDINQILILSDGMASHYEVFKLSNSYQDFFIKVKRIKLKQVYKEIKKTAYLDKKLNEFPRLKVIDDISMIKIIV